MKKVFVAFLTVLLILLAIAAVQAYAVPLMPALQVTKGDVTVTATVVPETDESKQDAEKVDPAEKAPSHEEGEEEIIVSEGTLMIGEPTEAPTEETAEPTVEPTEIPAEETTEPIEEPTETPAEETSEPTVEPTEIPAEEIDRDVVVTIKGNTVYAPYDGSRHAASGYVVSEISNGAYTESDFIFTGKAYVELIDAGVSYMGLTDDMFINKNNQFNVYFEIEDGYVEVSPINVEVEVIGMNESVVYDGDVHSVEGYTFRQIFPINQELYTEECFEFLGNAKAERNEAGISFMGLNGGSFKNISPNFGRVLFHVTDGYIEVTSPEEMVEETVEPTEEPTETVNEETVEPTEEPTETVNEETVEPTEEPTETVTEETVEPTEEVEESNQEKIKFAAGTVIYSETDMESAVIMTLEEEAEFPILTVYDTDWVEIQLSEDASGFVFYTITEGTEPTEEQSQESDEEVTEIAEDLSAEKVLLKSGTNIYSDVDEKSEILMTLEEDTEFSVVSEQSELVLDWLEIQLDPETTGYVVKPEEQKEEDINEEEEPEDKDNRLSIPAGTNVRVAADGMSEILYTFEEDTELGVFTREGDWLLINVSEEISGYIFVGDVQINDEEKETETVDNRKVTIFTSRRIVMPIGADIQLTSLLEGFEEGDLIQYQWECDKGTGFEPIDGAASDTYTYKATVESLTWDFRLNVTVTNAEEAAPEAAE